ncbi:hypothetical protein AMATHDRAFT_1191 [Amanita thiersii Skay4041]|uniref:WSC domain-containing protein n=1 Tax=Amanita thiersii Skay4041 TaxID=703135 RepID=A0A2A9NYG4_9AGAR|nr:hypothetical protein AMATHDRAFT_1191 [Amanita thiersii Skay4041]
MRLGLILVAIRLLYDINTAGQSDPELIYPKCKSATRKMTANERPEAVWAEVLYAQDYSVHFLHSLMFLILVAATLLIFPSERILAQSVPSLLPGNWSFIGCYTDISTSRTLLASQTVSDAMTVESCIEFCVTNNYDYAGVEFSRQRANLADCSLPCSGNATETCGGSNRMNMFYSGQPVPEIVQTVGEWWTYRGCFTDTVEVRTLGVAVNIPGGVNAESCTAACEALGGYKLAGLEFGHECWCDDELDAGAQHVSDQDCTMICDADHLEFCGNANRISIYASNKSSQSGIPHSCNSTNLANFTLQAVYTIPPTSAPPSLPLKPVLVELVPGITWTLLSACSNCCSEWPNFSLQNSIVFPKSPANPNQFMSSAGIADGESPSFVASMPAFPGFQGYCTMEMSAGRPVLAFSGKMDAFSLCKNDTANGRLDVVFSPVTGHPHYSLANCSPVMIEVVT